MDRLALPLRGRHRPAAQRAPASAAGGSGRGRLRSLRVLVVPRDVALEPVALVRGLADPVVLARVDDELGRDAEALQGLVHLLRVVERHVEVLVAAEKERGRRDLVRVQKRERHLDVGVGVLPRRSQLLLVLADVLVGPVSGQGVGDPGAAGGRLEARRRRDDVVGHHAAVAPASDRHPLRIHEAARDRVVHRAEHVLDVPVPPVGVDRGLEALAAPGAAPRIGRDDDVAVGGDPLPLLVEAELELADRAAVNAQHRRVSLAGLVVRRLDDEAVDLGPVLALEARLLDRPEADPGEPGVVLGGEAARLPRLDGVDLLGRLRRAREDRRVARGRGKARDHAPAADDALDRAAADGDLREVNRLVLFQHEEDRLSVGREARRQNVPIEGRCQDLLGPPGGRNDRELVQPVIDELVGSALHVGDPPAVRAPREAAVAPLGIVVRALEGRQLAHRGARARLDREHVPVVGAVRIRPALGDESDRPAVGRPGREQFVVAAGRQGLDLAGVAIDEVEMLVPRDEVSVAVELELEPVDHDRLLRLGLLRAFLILRRLGVGIVDHEHQALAVRRPVEVLDVPLHLREFFRLAPGSRQDPELGRVVLVAALRQEGQGPAVRAPARRRLGFLARRQAHGLLAVPGRPPDVGLVLVFLDVRRPHGIGHERAVGRNFGIGDAPHERQVVEVEGPR